MNKVFAGFVLACTLLAAAGPLEADCDTRYRLWRDGNNTFYKYGEVIVLSVGEEADLYIHAYPSRSEHPYSASAEIGAPTAFGVGGQRPQDVARVLRIRGQDPRKGKVSFTAVATGQTALGYQITDVVRPGTLDRVTRGCRIGQVRITVRATAPGAPQPRPEGPAPAIRTANDAAHHLITQLYTGILRRGEAKAASYPDSIFEQVQREGLQGLISIAETMTSSAEFRDWSLARTREALERSGVETRDLSREVLESQLLKDIYSSLYGAGSMPYPDAQRRLAGYLSACISGRGGNDACPRLARDLLTQPQYRGHNRQALEYLR